MQESLKNIEGFEISFHEKSKRIINIKIEDQIIDRLIFPFKKFNITTLEYKPFTRFTIAKSLNDITFGKLDNLFNSIPWFSKILITLFILGLKTILSIFSFFIYIEKISSQLK